MKQCLLKNFSLALLLMMSGSVYSSSVQCYCVTLCQIEALLEFSVQ
jgi:hypothetical protein